MVFMAGIVFYAGEIIAGYAERYRYYDSFIQRKYEKLDLIEQSRVRGKTVCPIFSSR